MESTFNHSVTIHNAIMAGKHIWYLLLNKQVRNALRVEAGDLIHVSLKKEVSDYGMPMPDELMAVLLEDESGSTHFHALTPGRQRSLIYLVSKVKNPESRISKALAILHHLNEEGGGIEYKRLNETIKEFNQRRRP